jgi:superfamily I DNA/RNA helicase
MESWRGMQGEKGVTKLLKACLPLDIAGSIAHEIFHSNALKLNTTAYRDNCILVRSAIQIRDLEGALVRLRIPYIVRGGRGLLQTEEVRDVLSYLRLATNPKDFMALVRASSVPRRGIGEVALEKIRTLANERYDGDLVRGADAGNSKLALFVAAVQQVQAVADKPLMALETALRATNYKTYIAEKYNKKNEQEKAQQKLENLGRFGELIKGLSEENPDMSLADLVFQLSIDRQTEDDESGKVVISTIHSAKGLEWKRVYVTNLYEGSLPHKFSMGNQEEIEEERRLFYVAATRAKDTLVLCIPGMLQQGPNTVTLAPSRFLFEIGIN